MKAGQTPASSEVDLAETVGAQSADFDMDCSLFTGAGFEGAEALDEILVDAVAGLTGDSWFLTETDFESVVVTTFAFSLSGLRLYMCVYVQRRKMLVWRVSE